MHTVAVIQARMSSTRLPGKVMKPLGEQPVIAWCVRAAQAIPGADETVVATSVDASDDIIADWCAGQQVTCIRGSLSDVLARYALAARQVKADVVMRLTADCPLLDPEVCGEVLRLLQVSGSDYASNIESPRCWPQGLDCEAFTAAALLRAEAEASSPYDHEHVTPYLRNNPQRFKLASLPCPVPGLGLERWTLDTPHDYDFLIKVTQHFHAARPPRYTEILDILKDIPEPHNRNL